MKKQLARWKWGTRSRKECEMENNRKLSASCVVFRNGQVLLVRHTYGAVKGKFLIPGGFAEPNELPEKTAEREVFEETKIKITAKRLAAVRFTSEEAWCIFEGEYLSGEPESDFKENDAAVFMDINTAVESEDVVETTRVLIKSLLNSNKNYLEKSNFVNSKFAKDEWQLYL